MQGRHTCRRPRLGLAGQRLKELTRVWLAPCRALHAGTNMPQEAKTLDGSAVLRIAFGPAARQAAVSTMGGLYYMDPFLDGTQPSKHSSLSSVQHARDPMLPTQSMWQSASLRILPALAASQARRPHGVCVRVLLLHRKLILYWESDKERMLCPTPCFSRCIT